MKQQGKSLQGLVIQPGRTLTLDRYGVIRGQVVYKVDASLAFRLAPSVGSAHPDSAGAYAWNNTIQPIESGLCQITTDYIGLASDPTGYEVEFIGTLSEEPIETHPKFVDSIGGTADNPLHGASFDQETGEFLCFPVDAPNNLGGVRSYLSPSSTVRVSWYTRNPSSGLWSLGNRSYPPGSIPSPPDSRNWLKTNWSRRDFGLIYQISEEYMASGKKGWNTLIYD